MTKTQTTTVSVIVLFAAAFTIWMRHLHAVPMMTLPHQSLPVPNAYVTWAAAYSSYVPQPPRAVDEIEETDPSVRYKNGEAVNRFYSPWAREAWLHKNAAALALVRRGLAQRYAAPDATAPDFYFYAHARELARLLAIESHALALRGDWTGATDSALDIVAMGRGFASGSGVVGKLVSCAFGAIGAAELRKTLPHLDKNGAAHALVRMKTIEHRLVPLSRTLTWEKRLDLTTLKDAMSHGELLPPELLNDDDKAVRIQSRWYFANNARIVADCSGLLDRYIAIADTPYIALKLPPAPKLSLADPIVADHFALSTALFFNNARDKTQQQLLLLAVALRVYKANTGAYPASLAALAPTCIHSDPPDPFGTGAPYRYRRQGSGYILYSIGPDGRDDGGRPFANQAFPGQPPANRLIMTDSSGDALAPVL